MKKNKPKIPQKLKDLVSDSAKRHAWNIGVSQYIGEVLYMDEDKEDIAAEMVINRRYLSFILKIYPDTIKQWKERGDDCIEEIIAHEVAHLATDHFYRAATSRYLDDGEMTDAWETCTQVIGQLSFKLNERNKKLYKSQ